MSVVTLQIGQCGNQLGCSLFDALASEPDAAPAFFREFDAAGGGAAGAAKPPGRKRWTARSVLIDMESKVVDAAIAGARTGLGDWSYAGSGSLTRASGSGNNWALGHNRYGPLVRDDALELVRREVEACDWLEGFLLLQSVAGGTGSGLGTHLAEALADDFREGQLVNVCVWPFESGEVTVQPYNALTALSHLTDVSDGLLLLQNEVLHATCTKMLGIARPGFTDLNKLAQGTLDFTTFSWPALLKRLRRMAITGGFLEEGADWGDARPTPAHRYRNRAAASTLLLRGAGAAGADASGLADPMWHAGWAAGEPLLVGASPAKLQGCEMAATLLATDQAAVAPLRRMQDRGYAMAASRAFLHQYAAHGLGEGELMAGFAAIEDILASYASL